MGGGAHNWPLEINVVSQAFRDGTVAVADVTEAFPDYAWDRPSPCAGWSALDVLRHTEHTARRALQDVRDSVSNGPVSARTPAELASLNENDLNSMRPTTPTQHLRKFLELSGLVESEALSRPSAAGYQHGSQIWNLTSMVGVLAVEWHLHAWDLAQCINLHYAPLNVDVLVSIFRSSTPYLPLPDTADWESLLICSGRAAASRCPF